MKRGLIVIATLFSLTACTGQQVQEAAGWTASAAVLAAVAVYEYKNDDEDHCDARCRQNEQRRKALRQAAEERRAAQRVAELNAALDVYLTAEPDAGTEQRSVVLVPDDPAVPQQSQDRLDALLLEEVPEN